MILLTATTMSLQVLLDAAPAANQAVIVAAFADHTTTAFTPGESDLLTNGTTAVTAVAAPSASTQRQVKYLSVYNADTATAVVTVRLNNNGTFRTIIKAALLPGERLEFVDGDGFKTLSSAGAVKTQESPPLTNTYFEAALTATQTPVAGGAFVTCIYNSETVDTKGAYNTGTGVWTVPESGKYLVSAFIHMDGFADGSAVAVSVFIGSTEMLRISEQSPSNPTASINAGCQVGGSTFMQLTAGQQITIRGFFGLAAPPGGTLRFVGTAGGELTYFRTMRIE